jgi:hypothetical protein
MAYCIACGKQGVRWPTYNPVACSMTCLAIRALGEYSASGDGFHCPDCGEYMDSDHCEALNQEEEG